MQTPLAATFTHTAPVLEGMRLQRHHRWDWAESTTTVTGWSALTKFKIKKREKKGEKDRENRHTHLHNQVDRICQFLEKEKVEKQKIYALKYFTCIKAATFLFKQVNCALSDSEEIEGENFITD